MGNCSCIDRSAAVSWADDEWDEWEWTAAGAGSPGRPGKKLNKLKEHLLARSPGRAEDAHHHVSVPMAGPTCSAGDASNYEVKIKISKRQLEELIRTDGDAGLQQALEGLLGRSHGWDLEQVPREVSKADTTGHHHHWRPNLHSIPETDGPPC